MMIKIILTIGLCALTSISQAMNTKELKHYDKGFNNGVYFMITSMRARIVFPNSPYKMIEFFGCVESEVDLIKMGNIQEKENEFDIVKYSTQAEKVVLYLSPRLDKCESKIKE